jgi:uncharacterized protein YcfJ
MALPAVTTIPVVSAPAFAAPAQDGYYQGRTWRDSRGRLRCKRRNGTTGLIIGGAAGALAGRAIDGGNNRTLGTVAGAAAGALLGRSVDRNRKGGYKCR